MHLFLTNVKQCFALVKQCVTMYVKRGNFMTTNINIRVDSEFKNALQGYAKLHNKTISDIILEAIKEKMENDDDYRLALLAYASVDMNDQTTLEDLCKEAGIDYESL